MNRRVFRLWSFLLFCAVFPRLFAAPVVTSVANAASNRAFFSTIAQGSIFVIKGSGLGPANISITPTPFQSTTLSGTSVVVLDTVGGTTTNALMYYTSATQVAALLPSNTPTGTGKTLRVTYNGESSNVVTVEVAKSDIGIFTINSSGQGPAIITFPDYSLVSAVKAANPGDTLVLWATGLGPVSGDDASGSGLGQNMPNNPLKLWLGGVEAPVIYRGRSGCCIGEDQIVFTVPNNVPTGCAVPLVVQSGNAVYSTNAPVSNTTVVPVASGSRHCTFNHPALASVDIEQAVMAGPVTFGRLQLRKSAKAGNGSQDRIQLLFAKIPSYPPGTEPFFASYVDDQPVGACIVYDIGNNGTDSYFYSNLTPLDAGSSFIVNGSNGNMTVVGNPGQTTSTLSDAGTFLTPGSYTISGTGGKDVGPFTATITLPPSPTLVSPSSASGLTVIRSSGMTVTWTGGDPSGFVEISLASMTDNTFSAGALVNCKAPASAGTFTIPSYVLLALPPGTFTGFELGPGTNQAAATAPFTATGLTVGMVQIYSDGTILSGLDLK